MKRALLLLLVFTASVSFAADWFVRPNGGAYGTEVGTSWTNAYDGFSDITWASIAAGDTIWVAGGTYNQALIPTKTGTSGNIITVARARSDASACTSAAGWSSGFDATVVQNDNGLGMSGNYDYITISGRTTASGGSEGWLIDYTGSTSGSGVSCDNGADADFITVEYVTLKGPGNINYTGDGRGVDLTPFSAASNWKISHCTVFNWESAIYDVGTDGSNIYEYILMYDIMATNWASFHPNGIITWASPNCIVRFCKFYRGPGGNGVGEGIFFEQSGGSTAWQIYGNLFYDLDSTGWKAIEVSSAVGALKVFNNTFVNCNETIRTSDTPSATGGEQRNNLTYNCGVSTVTGMTNGSNVTATVTGVFVDYASRDLRPVATIATNYPRNAGTALGSPYDGDMLGTTRGGDGTWDAGAYEYTAGGGDTTAPVISSIVATPTGLSTATITWTTDEASSSLVDVGTTTSYLQAGSPFSGSSGVTSHSVSITGLTAATTYHFRVRSTDASSNEAVSSDGTFTTLPPATIQVRPKGRGTRVNVVP
jgi:hypothetical protein